MSSISSTYANNSCIVACTSGSVTPCGALEHDLGREAGLLGRVRLEQFLHFLRLAGREREVGAVVGSDGTGDGVDDDQQSDPRTDHHPAMPNTGARQPRQRAEFGSGFRGTCVDIRRHQGELLGFGPLAPTMFARGCDLAQGTFVTSRRIDATAVSVPRGPGGSGARPDRGSAPAALGVDVSTPYIAIHAVRASG